MTTPRVLQIGMDPAVIDFSAWPGQSAATLQARLDAALDALRGAGFEVVTVLLPAEPDAAETAVAEALVGPAYDVVEIGSGLRTSHEFTVIFERVINAVLSAGTPARLCFNDSPETTLDAVRRGLAV